MFVGMFRRARFYMHFSLLTYTMDIVRHVSIMIKRGPCEVLSQ